MSVFHIKKGRDIKIKGAANKERVQVALPSHAAVHVPDFRGLKARLAVNVGDQVRIGTPLLADKEYPQITVCSPLSGKVAAINRGDKRALLDIVIESNGQKLALEHKKFSAPEIKTLTREVVKKTLLEGGLWPVIRQRPFSRIASLPHTPKSIFIHAMNTEPLSADVDYILDQHEAEFQLGIDIIKRLTDGKVHLCTKLGTRAKALTRVTGVEIHQFGGAHPTGNVGTHIHYIDPIRKGDVVWYIEYFDVVRIAQLFLTGIYPAKRCLVVTGEGAVNKIYVDTVMGAPLASCLRGTNTENKRIISGSVLTGRHAGAGGYLGFYDNQITVIPEGGERKFLGWLSAGFTKYTFSHMYASAFLPNPEFSLNTDENGARRAIVLNHIYDSLVTLDVLTYFLIRAVLSMDVEMAEKMGILECDEEDFALCTFACPSKTDVGAIIRQGLEVIEKEG